MKLYISDDKTAEMLQNLCVRRWIIGMGGIPEEMTRANVAIQNVISSAAKLGKCLRGTSYLVLLNDIKMRISMISFGIFAVPPMGDRHVKIYKD